jgi:hypothetical protein
LYIDKITGLKLALVEKCAATEEATARKRYTPFGQVCPMDEMKRSLMLS